MSRRFKSPKSPAPYIPSRANKTESDLRKIASILHTQHQLDHFLAQVSIRYEPMRRLQLQRASFEAVRPYLAFRAVLPRFLQDEPELGVTMDDMPTDIASDQS